MDMKLYRVEADVSLGSFLFLHNDEIGELDSQSVRRHFWANLDNIDLSPDNVSVVCREFSPEEKLPSNYSGDESVEVLVEDEEVVEELNWNLIAEDLVEIMKEYREKKELERKQKEFLDSQPTLFDEIS